MVGNRRNQKELSSGEREGKSSYKPNIIEPKWQKIWDQNGIYSPNLDSAKKPFGKAQGKPFYNLMMFPYPSAEGMHVGNMYAFTGADVYGRFKRMQGFDVFEPIGLDGFGIHSENYAIKVGQHPKEQAKISEANFYRQLRATGNGFDWSRKVQTYDPKYYKWTQWLFIQLFKKGLAYRKRAMVNFCPSCKTVLADEQVIDGRCERCATLVVRENREQWFFRITHYAEKLLGNIEKLNWSEKVKTAQRAWIGRSEGALITFKIKNSHRTIDVFTTRPDTLFGATFLVVSPEHPLVGDLFGQGKDVMNYVSKAVVKSEQERIAQAKEKEGVPTWYFAINPVNGQEIPIWIADYVLMGYGTGAIMAVPAHDQRDFEFAKKYKLPIRQVILRPIRQLTERGEVLDSQAKPGTVWHLAKPDRSNNNERKEAYAGEGAIVNSGEWNGWKVPERIGEVIDWLEKKDLGKRETTYHLRDWLISRQRYWGPPIPMIYCQVCAKKGNSGFTLTKKSSTKEDYLVNLKADSLNGWPDTLKQNIPKQNKDVNSQFEKGMDSPGVEPGRFGVSSQPSKPAEPMPESVYKSDDEFVNDWNSVGWFPVSDKDLPVLLPEVEDWKPKGTGKSPLATVESFVNTKCPNCKGSAERETDVSDTFLDSGWYFLRYTSTDIDSSAFDIERVKKWLPVDMYIGGAEHSVLHLLYSRFITMVLHDLGYISFQEPFSRFFAHGLLIKERAKMSKSKGNVVVPDEYIRKFGADTLRMYLMFLGPFSQGGDFYDTALEGMHRFIKRIWRLINQVQSSEFKVQSSEEGTRMMHKTIKKVTEDISGLKYNTAIASLMTYYNFLSKEKFISKEEIKTFLKLLAPFVPHMAEELFQLLRNSKLKTQNSKLESIHLQSWPSYDPRSLVENEVTIVVQVNGKMRDTIKSQKSKVKSQKYVQELARGSSKIKKYIEGRTIKKVVYVEGKIINFVTDGR